MYGLTESQFQRLSELIIDPIKRSGGDVFLFGSRATAKHHRFSDVDLLVVLKPSSTLDSKYLSSLRESIENSNFPFAVDLVNDADLAESYRKSVESQRIRL